MKVDEYPTPEWSDDEIRNWALKSGLDRYPIAKIALSYAVTMDKDMAIVHFDKPGVPVERVAHQRWFR